MDKVRAVPVPSENSSATTPSNRRNLKLMVRKVQPFIMMITERKSIAKNKAATETSLLKNEEFELSDRGSIRFLLNGGTDSFTERWRLPPRSDRARGMQYHTQKELEEATNTANPKAGFSSDFDDLTSCEDSFMSLITGPFPEPQRSMTDHFTGKFTAHPMEFPGQDPNGGMVGGSTFYESESSFSSALIQAILAKTWTINMDSNAKQEVSSSLHFLLTPRRINKFVSLYFQYWHHNCNIIHVPSFNLEQDSMPLLASVIFMGAMYSNDEREAYVARRMLDFAELYVFSADLFSSEHEICRTFVGQSVTDMEPSDWLRLQSLQAAFVMTVTQYWAGSKISRNRAMEVRYNEIVLVCLCDLRYA
jgi:Fungal specific transcription factor domain